MQLSVSSDGVPLGPNLHEYIDRRLRFALGRFRPAIDRVRVRVEDVNGPRGGVDKHCRIVVKLRDSRIQVIAVENHDNNLHASIARASDRAGRAVARALDRKRRKRAYLRRRAPAQGASSWTPVDEPEASA